MQPKADKNAKKYWFRALNIYKYINWHFMATNHKRNTNVYNRQPLRAKWLLQNQITNSFSTIETTWSMAPINHIEILRDIDTRKQNLSSVNSFKVYTSIFPHKKGHTWKIYHLCVRFFSSIKRKENQNSKISYRSMVMMAAMIAPVLWI